MMSVLVGTLFVSQSKAQINISINIGSQPEWGPTGYDYVDYYYLPDINAYYNVAQAQYIFWQGNRWRFAKRLPSRYRNYNIYNSYKVVVNRQTPYMNNQYDIQHYSMYKGRHSQALLRDNSNYRAIRNNGNHYGNNSNGNYANKNYNKGNTYKGNGKTVVKRETTTSVRQSTPNNRAVRNTNTTTTRTVTRAR